MTDNMCLVDLKCPCGAELNLNVSSNFPTVQTIVDKWFRVHEPHQRPQVVDLDINALLDHQQKVDEGLELPGQLVEVIWNSQVRLAPGHMKSMLGTRNKAIDRVKYFALRDLDDQSAHDPDDEEDWSDEELAEAVQKYRLVVAITRL